MTRPLIFLIYLLVLFSFVPSVAAISAVYAGGPVYLQRDYAIDELKNSGFSHLIIWTIHIEEDGSLGFNGEFPLVRDGEYIGGQTHPMFQQDVAQLKQDNSSIQRLEFGLSAAGSGTYANVRSLLACSEAHCGTGPQSVLYRNFKALRDAFPDVDALNNDDESTYDLASAVPFHIMLADIGFNTAIVPYTVRSFWQAFVSEVNSARPGSVDLTYLQGYAGGSGNNPCSWDLGIPVIPGLWSRYDTPAQVEAQMRSWKNNCDIAGGFMWLYDDFDNSPQVGEYAGAINSVFDDMPPSHAVALYQHCDYQGYQVALAPGRYSLSQLQALGMQDNDVSSLVVNEGYELRFYQNDGFSGYRSQLQGSDSCLTDNFAGREDNSSWNDDISSLEIVEVSQSKELKNGEVIKVSGQRGNQLGFWLTLPEGATGLEISVSGGSGDADLYVNFGSEPTLEGNYLCRPYRYGNNESCMDELKPNQAGRYYVLLHAYDAFSSVSLQASFQN